MYIDIRFWTQEEILKRFEAVKDQLLQVTMTTQITVEGTTIQKAKIMELEDMLHAYQNALAEFKACQDASVTQPFMLY